MAKPKATRKQLTELQEYEYIWCRVFGHDWEEWNSNGHKPQFGYYESVHCPRCTTDRLFTIASTGEVIARRYIYPEGYHLAFKVNSLDLRKTMRKIGWFDQMDKRKK